MPADLTIFAAKYLIFVDVVLAAGAVGLILYRRPRAEWIRWAIAIGVTVVVGYILAKVGAAVYNDPRPFSQDHVKPLIAHAADNGFPSDHALLGAAIVAAILLLDLRYVIVFIVLAALVDWARVGSGIHHVVDVVGSAVFIAIGLVFGYVVAPFLTRVLLPHVPERLLGNTQQTDAVGSRRV